MQRGRMAASKNLDSGKVLDMDKTGEGRSWVLQRSQHLGLDRYLLIGTRAEGVAGSQNKDRVK